MLIHADFSKSVILNADQYDWVPSPQHGVERVMLDRIGAEQARATSIVRYAQSSSFPSHQHPQGEEILVLSGTFSEQGADYPAGWYLRNPEGSSHQPSSLEGTVIFVKLRQMSQTDHQSIRINTNLDEAWHTSSLDAKEGVYEYCPLFENDNEKVELRKLCNQQVISIDSHVLTEILVLAGMVKVNDQLVTKDGWIRLAKGSENQLIAQEDQTKIYLKTMKVITNLESESI
ncbi:cupin domain-containing protein [Acinetobacter sichuanensis]|uniref:Anti-sigma factor n=1 Tax=Acinetobacter sichuanensis TaxID=2136183 RepID=A0A371YNH9_9GAMM|nr:cupin domain-containing protein [Acinetobacter sichuanensis]RFC83027.1 anti-sigma factor [Acinetobacter sichuanensis]